ncbi:pyroglutamyl peptidase [Nocardioides speluncae]|uniref:pyroglutamyl peptidase n=1 Tax=Nocardioides speluncae TaxID=2670337 RepID=UPI000D6981C1|nr:pyroglutamyl peptidase [Nocardioides speluncae]
MRLRFLRPAIAATALALMIPTSAATAAPEPDGLSCLDPAVTGNVEEQLVDRPQPQELIERGGYAGRTPAFTTALCRASDLPAARAVVRSHAAKLWEFAVDRAQGRVVAGDLSAGDDRPLYWTRLQITRALRQYTPSFALTPESRALLITDVDRISRGQDDIRFSQSRRVKRVLISGFDPFLLPQKITNSNPSGAGALALDGHTVSTPAGRARIEAVLLPVRWRDFADGMVERSFAPYLRQVDLFSTTSQGRVGRFDLEVNNGVWRGGFIDNEGVCYRGRALVREGFPTVTPQPEWTRSTLPFAAMTPVQGAFPVVENHRVVEVPGDTPEEPVTVTCPAAPSPGTAQPNGPTPGSQARQGGGGNYLSNESAYRATLVRDALGLHDLPGGHIHTPVLEGLGDPAVEITNPTFEANRTAIADQVRKLLIAAVGSLAD